MGDACQAAVRQMVLRAGRYDLIVLVVADDATPYEVEEVREIATSIHEDTQSTIAVFPESVLKDARVFTLTELIEFRDEIDALIQYKASDVVGEA